MEIVNCGMQHIEKIVKLSDSLFVNGWSKKQFEIEINDINSKAILVIENDDLVGFLFAKIICEDMEILNVAVDKKYQGHGYGSELLKNIIDYAECKNIQNIFLEVNDKNAKAINLYSKFGFVLNRRRKNYYGADDGLELVKKIKKTV